ncbi:hypothetical protein VT91_12070 [Clostridium sporogenes]|uniref:hypothetical protein n=1 Tax=Clostridium botulinum TaxID=1491 RepID=UPI00071768A3|nr:hypothetical protein [Clostridium botulinum]KRU25943.1 hypothetical protein WG71_28100 [Clostridium sporogenes]KRU32624.1 hypothetical protein VT91_12070 [Clostridium sporogenes]KRU34470.1 hypothetical protein VT28_03950 [Clostridium sporogenes]KRU39976.1 hypothetical protein VT95_27620 [Clostridium sporogenes]MCW6073641.1 hypothetical protein [Clostridium botulinum]
MRSKAVKIILSCTILLSFYMYTHSTVERVIRTDLFLKGYFIKAFKTEISELPIPDKQYGTLYICNNPAIDPDHYDVDYKHIFGKVKYWYINLGTGGG